MKSIQGVMALHPRARYVNWQTAQYTLQIAPNYKKRATIFHSFAWKRTSRFSTANIINRFERCKADIYLQDQFPVECCLLRKTSVCWHREECSRNTTTTHGSAHAIKQCIVYIHCVSKKVPTFKLSVTLSNLNRFSKFCTAGKRMKFATKPMRQHSPHLRHVATLPWKIKNSNFLQILSRHCRNANILHFNRL